MPTSNSPDCEPTLESSLETLRGDVLKERLMLTTVLPAEPAAILFKPPTGLFETILGGDVRYLVLDATVRRDHYPEETHRAIERRLQNLPLSEEDRTLLDQAVMLYSSKSKPKPSPKPTAAPEDPPVDDMTGRPTAEDGLPAFWWTR